MLEDLARLTRFCEGFDQVEDFLPTARPGTLLLFYFGRKLQFRSDTGDIKVRGKGILRDINDTGETCTLYSQRAGNVDVLFSGRNYAYRKKAI